MHCSRQEQYIINSHWWVMDCEVGGSGCPFWRRIQHEGRGHRQPGVGVISIDIRRLELSPKTIQNILKTGRAGASLLASQLQQISLQRNEISLTRCRHCYFTGQHYTGGTLENIEDRNYPQSLSRIPVQPMWNWFRAQDYIKNVFSHATSAEALVEILSSSGFWPETQRIITHTKKYMFSQK